MGHYKHSLWTKVSINKRTLLDKKVKFERGIIYKKLEGTIWNYWISKTPQDLSSITSFTQLNKLPQTWHKWRNVENFRINIILPTYD